MNSDRNTDRWDSTNFVSALAGLEVWIQVIIYDFCYPQSRVVKRKSYCLFHDVDVRSPRKMQHYGQFWRFGQWVYPSSLHLCYAIILYACISEPIYLVSCWRISFDRYDSACINSYNPVNVIHDSWKLLFSAVNMFLF